jgi:hypothetical protein
MGLHTLAAAYVRLPWLPFRGVFAEKRRAMAEMSRSGDVTVALTLARATVQT